MRKSTRIFIPLLSMVAVQMAGCEQRPQMGQVEGTVKLNGQPLAEVEIQFLPDPSLGTRGPRSKGRTDENGHFRLICDDLREGAIVGTHRVFVRDMKPYDAMNHLAKPKAQRPPMAKDRIPKRFSDQSTTPLRKTVEPGRQTIDIEIHESQKPPTVS